MIGFLFVLAVPCLKAQDYRTDFVPIRADRGKTPESYHDIYKINDATGAVEVTVPIGPGIGARGLHFTPTLQGHWSPQWSGYAAQMTEPYYTYSSMFDSWGLSNPSLDGWTNYIQGALAGGFDPLFGGLQLNFGYDNLRPLDGPGGGFTTAYTLEDTLATSFTLPDGTHEDIYKAAPPLASVPNVAQVVSLLKVFGYDASWTVANQPYQVSQIGTAAAQSSPMIQMGSDGGLVVGIWNNGSTPAGSPFYVRWCLPIPPDPAWTTGTQNGSTEPSSCYLVPPLILVIKGDVAYEFAFDTPYYGTGVQLAPTPPGPPLTLAGPGHTLPQGVQAQLAPGNSTQVTIMYGANYHLTRMLNRYGDQIVFTNTGVSALIPNGMPTLPTASSLSVPSTATWVPAVGGPGASISLDNQSLQLSYNGGNEILRYQLSSSASTTPAPPHLTVGGIPVAPDYPELMDTTLARPILGVPTNYSGVTDLGTGETLAFNYNYVMSPANDVAGVNKTPYETVLAGLVMPGESVAFDWTDGAFTYANTVLRGTSSGWAVALVQAQEGNPAFALNPDGTTNGQPPLLPALFPQWSYGVVRTIETDTATGNARVEQHTRVSPQPHLSPVPNTWPTAPNSSQPAAPEFDSSNLPFYDAVTHPDGRVTVMGYVQPSLSQVMSVGPDAMRGMVYLKHQPREIREYAAGISAQDAAQDYLGTLTSPATSRAYRITDYDRWDLRSPSNSTGAIALSAMPHPTRIRTWDANNQILTVEEDSSWDATNRGYGTHTKWVATSLGDLGTTDYQCLADSGAAQADPAGTMWKAVTQRTLGSSLANWYFDRSLSEQTTVLIDTTRGLAAGQGLPYAGAPVTRTFDDSTDHLMSVTRGTSSLFTKVALGYGTSGAQIGQMTSAVVSGSGGLINSNAVGDAYQYDNNGFMNLISPLGVAWTHGQSQDGLGYTESQTAPDGKTTQFGWDSGGRLKTLTPPDGLQPTIVTYDSDALGMTTIRGLEVRHARFNGFGELVMEERSFDGSMTFTSHKSYSYDLGGRKAGETAWLPGGGNSTDWTTPNLVPANPGVATAYDGQGRVIQTLVTDTPNLVSTTSYGVLSKAVTTNGATTKLTYDPTGRLVQTMDPLGQMTTYGYDPMSRIALVSQSDAGGRTQSRSWNYNALGWLITLVQPESGTTSYSAFTVTGKPTTTTYGFDSAAQRVVNATLDSLDRTTSLMSTDGTVSQIFSYDGSPANPSGNGKLVDSRDQGVEREYTYLGQGGALSHLDTYLWTGGTAGSGTSQAFPQMFTYDTYGNRAGGTTGHATWGQTFDVGKGLPLVLSSGSATLATASYYDSSTDSDHARSSWALKQLTFGNGVTSQFGYDFDQSRLLFMNHLPAVSGAAFVSWAFGYDSRGNLLSATDTAAGKTDRFGYDLLDRLTFADMNGRTQEFQQVFSYDAFGNRTLGSTSRVTGWSQGVPTLVNDNSVPAQMANTTFSAVDAAFLQNHLSSTTASGVLTGAVYDGQGNLTTIWETPGLAASQVTMQYDSLARVTSLAYGSTGVSEKYFYSADGLRTIVQVFQNGTIQTTKINLYDDRRKLVSQWEWK